MGLIRLILLGLVIFFAYQLFKRWLNPPRPRQTAAKQDRMLRCEHCGLYVPEPEAVREGSHSYCSEAHRIEARKQHP